MSFFITFGIVVAAIIAFIIAGIVGFAFACWITGNTSLSLYLESLIALLIATVAATLVHAFLTAARQVSNERAANAPAVAPLNPVPAK